MAYCPGDGGDGLGAVPWSVMPVTAVMAPKKGGFQSTLMYQQLLARKQAADAAEAAAALAKKMAAAQPPPVSPTGAVPPPADNPLDNYVPPQERPRPDTGGGSTMPVPSFAPGPITVSVSPGLQAPAEPAPKGFGMVEAGIAAGLALLLGAVLAKKGKR